MTLSLYSVTVMIRESVGSVIPKDTGASVICVTPTFHLAPSNARISRTVHTHACAREMNQVIERRAGKDISGWRDAGWPYGAHVPLAASSNQAQSVCRKTPLESNNVVARHCHISQNYVFKKYFFVVVENLI